MPRSPTYNPPTLAEFRTMLLRTLRDPQGLIFGFSTLNEIINEGMMSLDGYRPMESVEAWNYPPHADDPPGSTQFIRPLFCSSVWMVVAMNEDDPTDVNQSLVIPYNSPDQSLVQVGWDFYNGAVHFGRWMVNRLDAWRAHTGSLSIYIYGYRDRNIPTDDSEVLDLGDGIDHLCLSRECRATALHLLNNDRALYQQWLAATNNTDVSPTQLQGMLSSAVGDVERQRKRSAILRRTPFVGPQYT